MPLPALVFVFNVFGLPRLALLGRRALRRFERFGMGRKALLEDAVYGVGPTIFVADDFIGDVWDVCHVRASVACVRPKTL